MTGALLARSDDAVDAVPAALAALRRGEPVVLASETGEHQLVIAAERVTATAMALLVRHSSGFVCVAVGADRLAALDIPLQPADDAGREAFAVSVDALGGLTTGISARERAQTARALADPATRPEDLSRPGHVVPVQVHQDGVLGRPAAAEAAADLCRLAGLAPAAVFAALPDSEREPLLGLHDSPVIGVADVILHRQRVESSVRHLGDGPLTNRHGSFQRHSYLDVRTGREHLAVVAGDVVGHPGVPVRVHTECPAGDLLGSMQCSCADDLERAFTAMATAGRGVLVYLRGGPSRGRRHAVSAGAPPETAHGHRAAAHVLQDLGIGSAVLLTDDPADASDLTAFGVPVVGCRPLTTAGRHDLRVI